MYKGSHLLHEDYFTTMEIDEPSNWHVIKQDYLQQICEDKLELNVKAGVVVKADQPVTKDPNVGGFGQTETEIVLQSPARIYGYMVLVFFVILTQITLILKKKKIYISKIAILSQ